MLCRKLEPSFLHSEDVFFHVLFVCLSGTCGCDVADFHVISILAYAVRNGKGARKREREREAARSVVSTCVEPQSLPKRERERENIESTLK